MRVTNMQLAHSNNRPACPIYSNTAPPDGQKSKKNVSMRSYRRLATLSLSFRCNKLLTSSTERRVWYSKQIIFSRLRICQRKHFPSVIPSPSLPPVFMKTFQKTPSGGGEHISEAILWTHLPWNPAVEADKSLLGFPDIYIWAVSFTCGFLAWEFLKL